MSTDYGKKLRLIRKAERLTQAQLCELTGINIGSVKNYETQGVEVGLRIIEKVLAVGQLQKYALWLMTDQVAPESGQIAPKGHETLEKNDDNSPAIKQNN